jgi:RNA polymerase sigma-70 factor (ECF subfamily)
MSVDDRSDAEIVAAVLGGDDRAFGALINRYQNAYLRYATRMLNSQDDAEDALQSAFIRAYRNLSGCRDPKRFGPWLQKIVVNECRTFGARRSRRELKFDSRPATLEGIASSSADGTGEFAEEINVALQRLPAEQREAFLLRYAEDLGYDEMAELTGAGVSALKMRVKRACESMKANLEGVIS